MNYQEEYKKKLRTPEEAVQVVKSGDWIDYTANICFPYLLDKALAKRKEELHDLYSDDLSKCHPLLSAFPRSKCGHDVCNPDG